jgi:hypothetical protein
MRSYRATRSRRGNFSAEEAGRTAPEDTWPKIIAPIEPIAKIVAVAAQVLYRNVMEGTYQAAFKTARMHSQSYSYKRGLSRRFTCD